MLARRYRIGSKPRVLHILKKGRVLKWGGFYFRRLPNRAGHPRFALIVSKKIGRQAVTRNRVRRRVYEAIRKNLGPHEKSCYDVVVLCSAAIASSDYPRIERDIIAGLKKISSSSP